MAQNSDTNNGSSDSRPISRTSLSTDDTWAHPRPSSRRQAEPNPITWSDTALRSGLYTKPWGENERDYEGRLFQRDAKRVCEALRIEDSDKADISSITSMSVIADAGVRDLFHPSRLEGSKEDWQEIMVMKGFLQKFSELTDRFASAQTNQTLTSRPVSVASPCESDHLRRFFGRVRQTVISQYSSLFQLAATHKRLGNQLRLLFAVGRNRGSPYCRRLIARSLQLWPHLHFGNHEGRPIFDPCFLEEYRHGLAQIVHELGRIFSLAHFESLSDGDQRRWNLATELVNVCYAKVESQHPSKMKFDWIFCDGYTPPDILPESEATGTGPSATDENITMQAPDDNAEAPPHIEWVDFSFTRKWVNENAPESSGLLDAETGQLRFDVAHEVDHSVLSKIYHKFEDQLFDYMCIGDPEKECHLFKAKRILQQKWAVPSEIIRALTLVIRYRRAATRQCNESGDNLDDKHAIWTDKMVEVGILLRQAAEAATKRGENPAKSCEPLHGQFRDSLSRRWLINRWSKKPFFAELRDMQPQVSRAFAQCFHNNPAAYDFAWSPVLRSIHSKLVLEYRIPKEFKPSLQKIRWIEPFLPYQMETIRESNKAPGTLVLVRYNRGVPIQESQNFDHDFEQHESPESAAAAAAAAAAASKPPQPERDW